MVRGLLGCQVPGGQRGTRSVNQVLVTLQRSMMLLLCPCSDDGLSSSFSFCSSTNAPPHSFSLQGEIGRPGLKVSHCLLLLLVPLPHTSSTCVCPWINRIWTLSVSHHVIGAIDAAGGGLKASHCLASLASREHVIWASTPPTSLSSHLPPSLLISLSAPALCDKSPCSSSSSTGCCC